MVPPWFASPGLEPWWWPPTHWWLVSHSLSALAFCFLWLLPQVPSVDLINQVGLAVEQDPSQLACSGEYPMFGWHSPITVPSWCLYRPGHLPFCSVTLPAPWGPQFPSWCPVSILEPPWLCSDLGPAWHLLMLIADPPVLAGILEAPFEWLSLSEPWRWPFIQ